MVPPGLSGAAGDKSALVTSAAQEGGIQPGLGHSHSLWNSQLQPSALAQTPRAALRRWIILMFSFTCH
jgi:hypothetical protein